LAFASYNRAADRADCGARQREWLGGSGGCEPDLPVTVRLDLTQLRDAPVAVACACGASPWLRGLTPVDCCMVHRMMLY